MDANEFSIVAYKASDASELLRLLLELHNTYFQTRAASHIREMNAEMDIRRSYEDYVNLINVNNDGNWKILLAASPSNKKVGFIIGSITQDYHFIRSKIGKIEDWFVEEEYRGSEIGIRLYNELEKWFRENGCQQVISDTWEGNELSMKAHKKLGFFVSGVQFGKKLQ
jgi:GNAT superfamily N-acetyltransferase